MAAISSANVSVIQAYEFGSRTGKSHGLRQILAITLSAQGGTAGDIPASALGLKQITNVQSLGAILSGNPRYVGVGVSALGSDSNYIYPVDLTQATDANRATPANITGTLYVMVEGIPAAA
jgi:hypothetical protein